SRPGQGEGAAHSARGAWSSGGGRNLRFRKSEDRDYIRNPPPGVPAATRPTAATAWRHARAIIRGRRSAGSHPDIIQAPQHDLPPPPWRRAKLCPVPPPLKLPPKLPPKPTAQRRS